MTRRKNSCLKNAELILGCRLQDAPNEEILGLLVVGVCKMALTRAERRKTGKRINNKKCREISKLLYIEVMSRMNKNKTA